MLEPVVRRSVSDAVIEQLRDRIVGGDLEPGSALPAERALCEALGVNRGSVREALRRLEQAGLVSVRHGGTSEVNDYRRSAGLDLLADLIVTPSGDLDLDVIRSVVEMRSALAPDIARLAALRGGADASVELRRLVGEMRAQASDLAALQDLASEFWSQLVDASGNLAYRLAYNSMRASYDQSRALFTQVLADELRDLDACEAIASAVAGADGETAEREARALIRRGERAIVAALEEAAQ